MPTRRQIIAGSMLAGIAASGQYSLAQQSKEQSQEQSGKANQTEEAKAPPAPVAGDLVKQFVGVSHGNLARVKELVKQEPQLVFAVWDWQGGDFESGLGAASHVGNRDIANFLLDNDARIDAFAMAMLGHTDLVAAILKAYPDTHRVPGPHGIPLLSHAIYGKEPAQDVLELLLKNHADVNQASNGGQTPLMAAASIGRVEAMELLIASGADPSLADQQGRTALDYATTRKQKLAEDYLKKLN